MWLTFIRGTYVSFAILMRECRNTCTSLLIITLKSRLKSDYRFCLAAMNLLNRTVNIINQDDEYSSIHNVYYSHVFYMLQAAHRTIIISS